MPSKLRFLPCFLLALAHSNAALAFTISTGQEGQEPHQAPLELPSPASPALGMVEEQHGVSSSTCTLVCIPTAGNKDQAMLQRTLKVVIIQRENRNQIKPPAAFLSTSKSASLADWGTHGKHLSRILTRARWKRQAVFLQLFAVTNFPRIYQGISQQQTCNWVFRNFLLLLNSDPFFTCQKDILTLYYFFNGLLKEKEMHEKFTGKKMATHQYLLG